MADIEILIVTSLNWTNIELIQEFNFFTLNFFVTDFDYIVKIPATTTKFGRKNVEAVSSVFKAR